MADQIVGEVAGIAIRAARHGSMTALDEAVLVAHGGLEGDLPSSMDRGITLLSSQQWAQVTQELGKALSWHTRRANLLVDAPGLGDLIGRIITIGSADVAIKGETEPCGLMDEQYRGLRRVLVPDCRGGVHGRIVQPGRFRMGDVVVVKR